jgi:hypothetical protein
MDNLSTEQLFVTEAAKALLENQEHSLFLNLCQYQRWDLGGVDALQLAKQLVGDVVAKIAPFQSLDVIFTGYQYSALCLGEDNFRLGLYGDLGAYGGLNFEETIRFAIADASLSHAQAATGLRAWARKCDRMNAEDATASDCAISLTACYAISLTACCGIALSESVALDVLPKIAVVQPPHHLEGLQPNCAVAAKIDGVSVLIWRHQLLSLPVFELHTPVGDAEAIKVKLRDI